jgi:adenylate cyclase
VLAASAHNANVVLGFGTNPELDRSEARRLVQLALELDENDENVLGIAAFVAAFFDGDYDTGIAFADRGVTINANDSWVWVNRGWVYKYAGQFEEAIRSFEHAIRLSPLDPWLFHFLSGIGFSLIELGRFDEAVAICKKALRLNSADGVACRGLAAALAHLGRHVEAREPVARLLEVDPSFTVSGWIARGGQTNSRLLIEGLRKARLPE